MGGGGGDDVQVREFESARDLCQQVRSKFNCSEKDQRSRVSVISPEKKIRDQLTPSLR